MTPRKDMEEVVREAGEQGWRVQKTDGGHWRLYSPDGRGIVHAAGTPGSARSVQKTIARLRQYGFMWKGH